MMTADQQSPVPVAICRACIVECKEYKSLSKEGLIFGEVTTLASLLAFATGLEFVKNKENNGLLPDTLCVGCMQELARSYLFKRKVLASNEILRSQLLGDEVDEKEMQDEKESGVDKGKEISGTQKHTETDLQELAEAAHMKRELEGQLYDANEQYTLAENDDDEAQMDDEQSETQAIEDEYEYVIQEVAETTEIYHTSDVDNDDTSQTEVQNIDIEEETVDIHHIESDEEIEYEIHASDVEESFHEIITDDPVENRTVIKRDFEDEAGNSDSNNRSTIIAPKGTRNRQKSANKAPNPEFQCKVCDKQLSTSSSLKYHMQLHSNVTSFKCKSCGEGFKTRNAYDGHIATHDPHNPNTCKVCGKSYRQPSSLRVHMISHTGEKMFNCEICGKNLTQKSGYKKHLLTHTGTKMFVCDICGKSFSSSSNLLVHRRCHSSEKNFHCLECGEVFPSVNAIENHMVQGHKQDGPLKCPYCFKRFKRKSAFRSHFQDHVSLLETFQKTTEKTASI